MKIFVSILMAFFCLITYSQTSIFIENDKANFSFRNESFIRHPVKKNLTDKIQIIKKIGAVEVYSTNEAVIFEFPISKLGSFVQEVPDLINTYNSYKPQKLSDSLLFIHHAKEVHSGQTPLLTSYYGNGVLVGVIDVGIDYTHPDFFDDNGNTRILKIWDQTNENNPSVIPSKYGYGQVWDSTSIVDGTLVYDQSGEHGNNVAGITSGRGNVDGDFTGLAPNSKLIIVENDLYSPNWMMTIYEAIDFIFEEADRLNRPCVINISLGTYGGAHDDNDDVSQLINQKITEKKGRVVVCAAGNSGESKYHLQHNVDNDSTFTWFSYEASNVVGVPGVFFESWIDLEHLDNLSFKVGANLSSGSFADRGEIEEVSLRDVLTSGVPVFKPLILSSGNNIGNVEFYGGEINGRYLMQVFIREPDSTTYNYRLETIGKGKIDIWSSKSYFGSSNINQTIPSTSVYPDIVNYTLPDNYQTMVSGFSCSPEVITVGNIEKDLTFIDAQNNLQFIDRDDGVISDASSRGPSREGVLKPDVSASGTYIMTVGSVNYGKYLAENIPSAVTKDSLHIKNGGTSMASPVVAGSIALLFEKCNNLSNQDVLMAIKSSSNWESFYGVQDNNPEYGAGRINTFELLNYTTRPVLIDKSVTSFCDNEGVLLKFSENINDALWNTGIKDLSYVEYNSGSYFANVMDSYGCVNKSDTITITSKLSPSKPIIQLSNDTLYTVSLFPYYQWYLNGVPIDNSNNNYFVIEESGDYYVEVFNHNLCANQSDTESVLFNSIEKYKQNNFDFYPNPFTDFVTFEVKDEFLVNVYDVNGKVLFNSIVNQAEKTLNLQFLKTGVYQVVLMSEKEVINIKILKQ